MILLDPFEARSRELARQWGIATSGRCRGLLLAAQGDLTGAERAIDIALQVHDTLPLPFEHARTLMVAGEVSRRSRHRMLAARRLRQAQEIFERLGAPLWISRAQADLDRIGTRDTAAPIDLTETERRVADLVALGMGNARVAAQLFMSRRTVEAHLSASTESSASARAPRCRTPTQGS